MASFRALLLRGAKGQTVPPRQDVQLPIVQSDFEERQALTPGSRRPHSPASSRSRMSHRSSNRSSNRRVRTPSTAYVEVPDLDGSRYERPRSRSRSRGSDLDDYPEFADLPADLQQKIRESEEAEDLMSSDSESPNERGNAGEDEGMQILRTNSTDTSPGAAWPSYRRFRRQVRRTLEDPTGGPVAMCVSYFVFFTIVASTACALLATEDSIAEQYSDQLEAAEMVFTGLFTCEILLRFWTAKTMWHYLSAHNLIDVLATLPWYGEQLVIHFFPRRQTGRLEDLTGSMRLLRLTRLVRLVRLAKVARHSETVPLVLESLVASTSGLAILFSLLGMGTIVSATAVYAVEFDTDEGQFTSIPIAMWWALTTITTVGYGDMVPQTVVGKLIGSATMVGGTIIVSLSVATITSSFTEQYRKRSEIAKVKKAIEHRRRTKTRRFTTGKSEDFSPHAQRQESLQSQILLERLAALEEETKQVLLLLEGEASYLDETEAEMECQATGLAQEIASTIPPGSGGTFDSGASTASDVLDLSDVHQASVLRNSSDEAGNNANNMNTSNYSSNSNHLLPGARRFVNPARTLLFKALTKNILSMGPGNAAKRAIPEKRLAGLLVEGLKAQSGTFFETSRGLAEYLALHESMHREDGAAYADTVKSFAPMQTSQARQHTLPRVAQSARMSEQ